MYKYYIYIYIFIVKITLFIDKLDEAKTPKNFNK